MPARFQIDIDGEPHALEVENLSHRRFSGGGEDLHVHPSYHLILVSMGSCRMRLADRAPVTVGEGELIAIDPMIPHAFTGAPGRGAEHTCLIWRFRNRRGGYSLRPLHRLSGVDGPAVGGYLVRRLKRTEAHAFLRKQREAEEAFRSGDPFLASLRAFELLFVGLNHVLPTLQQAGDVTPAERSALLVARITAVIDRELADPGLGVAAIASRVGLHPSYMSAVFRERMGISVGRYITDQRIALVKALLDSSDCDIKQAAALAGFQQHSYFSRVFRRQCGMAPRDYRLRAASPVA